MKRFVDTNVFIYSITDHPKFGEISENILKRVEKEEKAVTTTLVLSEVSWILEAMGKQADIKPTLEKILSYENLEILEFDSDDLIVGSSNVQRYGIDFNNGVNAAVMAKAGVTEVYSNDRKHLGKIDFLDLIFE